MISPKPQHIGLACAIKPLEDCLSLQLTTQSCKQNSTKITRAETEIIKLNSNDDFKNALTKTFNYIDSMIRSEHQGKVKLVFGIESPSHFKGGHRKHLRRLAKLTNCLEKMTGRQIATSSKKFKDQVAAFAQGINLLFAQNTNLDKSAYELDTAIFDANPEIRENINVRPIDNKKLEGKINPIKTYIHLAEAAIREAYNSFTNINGSTNLRQITIDAVKDSSRARLERARFAIAKDRRIEFLRYLANCLGLNKAFAVKFLNCDPETPPLTEHLTVMLYEDAITDDLQFKGKIHNSVYIP